MEKQYREIGHSGEVILFMVRYDGSIEKRHVLGDKSRHGSIWKSNGIASGRIDLKKREASFAVEIGTDKVVEALIELMEEYPDVNWYVFPNWYTSYSLTPSEFMKKYYSENEMRDQIENQIDFLLEKRQQPSSLEQVINGVKKALISRLESQWEREKENWNPSITMEDWVEMEMETKLRIDDSEPHNTEFAIGATTFGFSRQKSKEFEDIREFMSNVVEKYGWFVLQVRKDGLWFYVDISPNYTERLKSIPPYLYHVTPEYNLQKILKKGLIPTSRAQQDNRFFPNRVYLFSNQEVAEKVAASWRMSYAMNRYYGVEPNSSRGENEFVVLRIATSLADRGTKFYSDPEFLSRGIAYWTYSRIPPQAIQVVERI